MKIIVRAIAARAVAPQGGPPDPPRAPLRKKPSSPTPKPEPPSPKSFGLKPKGHAGPPRRPSAPRHGSWMLRAPVATCPSGLRSLEHESPKSLCNKTSRVQTFVVRLRASAHGDPVMTFMAKTVSVVETARERTTSCYYITVANG